MDIRKDIIGDSNKLFYRKFTIIAILTIILTFIEYQISLKIIKPIDPLADDMKKFMSLLSLFFATNMYKFILTVFIIDYIFNSIKLTLANLIKSIRKLSLIIPLALILSFAQWIGLLLFIIPSMLATFFFAYVVQIHMYEHDKGAIAFTKSKDFVMNNLGNAFLVFAFCIFVQVFANVLIVIPAYSDVPTWALIIIPKMALSYTTVVTTMFYINVKELDTVEEKV